MTSFIEKIQRYLAVARDILQSEKEYTAFKVPPLPNTLKKIDSDKDKEYLAYIKKILELLHQDPMTGFLHKESFRSLSDLSPGVFIFIDGDGLKALNTKYGHDAGHAAILSISDGIKAVRADLLTHLVTRAGGDEFILHLENVSIMKGKAWAEWILKSINSQTIGQNYLGEDEEIKKALDIPVGVSIGVGYTVEEANKAMQKAKDTGKNKVVLYVKNKFYLGKKSQTFVDRMKKLMTRK